MAMALNPDDIAATWSSSTDSYSSMQSNVLNNIFTTGDTRHFGIITQSPHANTHIDLSQLEDYYEVPMNNGERTGVNVVLEPQDNTGGSTIDPVDETPTGETGQDNETTGGSETGRDSECPPNCILGEDVEDASSKDSSLIGPQSLLLILVVLLLLAVGLLTRGSDEEADLGADQTVIIENQWQDETKQFVPELPPLTPPPSSEEE